ncbi:general odorant-binding protein 19d-like [Coccinella septempunctata]|uniref:general odorant-binding protein 19d-like n=1 Tax=Coccinella septempunctata TaxID=41139 RepID=UPI001D075E4D|nr:general odorant-binding protein 19d-like [Coccinella septempunctata]
MFKFVVLLTCAFVAVNAVSEELKGKFLEKMTKIGGECAKEVGANEDDIAELMAHKLPSRHEGECMIFCFHKHLGLMNEDGTLNKEGAMKAAEPLKADDPELHEKVVKIGKECAEEVAADDDKCKYATKLTECVVKKGKAMGLDSSVLH